MQSIRRNIATAVRAIAIAVLLSGAAAAQTPTRDTVQSTVTVATVLDDNVLSRAVATADSILRVTPGLSFSHTSARFNIGSSYSFDAERYTERTDLTTAQARQSAVFSAIFQATRRTSLTWAGGYASTTNPGELNTLTAVSVARARAGRWQGSSSISHGLTPHARVDAAYDVVRDVLTTQQVTMTHTAGMHVTRQTGPHTEAHVAATVRRFDFGTSALPVNSMLFTGGWSLRGRLVHLRAEGGAQSTNGAIGPTADVSVGRAFGATDLTADYGRSVTTALGVAGTVAFDRVQVSLAYSAQSRQPGASGAAAAKRLRVAFRAGVTRNQLPTGDARSYYGGFDVTKPLSRTLSMQVSYDGALQQAALGSLSFSGGDIRRNRLSFTVSLTPWSAR